MQACFLVQKGWIILRCCHLGRGSARGLERVKSDPKGEGDRLRNEGGERRGKRFLLIPTTPPSSLLQTSELDLLFSFRPWKTRALQATDFQEFLLKQGLFRQPGGGGMIAKKQNLWINPQTQGCKSLPWGAIMRSCYVTKPIHVWRFSWICHMSFIYWSILRCCYWSFLNHLSIDN